MNNILVDSKYENLRDTEQMGRFIQPSILALESILKSYFFFHLFFIILIATEILALSFFFTFLSKSYLLAIALAGLFLTIFSYFISQIYFRAKKEISLLTCLDDYAKECQGTMDYEEGHPASHIFLSQAYGRLADHLQGKEYYIIKYGTSLPNLRPLLEKFSCWLYWHDLFFIKELLLKKNIEENIKLIKSEPISVESHIALANAYVMLTGLYIDPRKLKNQEIERWIPSNVFDENMKNQFQTAAKKAIEEFKIIQEFAPSDPWVYIQLAYSYHDLNMFEEEIACYEKLLSLHSNDKEILLKMGALYFQLGYNAKGLKIYDTLKKLNPAKAENLIKYYGAYENV